MTRRSWFILLAVTVLTAIGGVWTMVERNARLAEQTWGERLFAGLTAADVNRVARIRLNTGQASWTVRKGVAGDWFIVEKDGYRADLDRVKQAIVALIAARIIAPKTADPALHYRLNLEAPAPTTSADAPAKSVEIDLIDGDGAMMAQLLVGKSRTLPSSRAPGQVYVRRKGEDQTWLIESRLDLRKDAGDWLDKEMVKIDGDMVRAVTFRAPDGAVLKLKRNRFGRLNVVGLPGNLAERDARLASTQRMLEYLPFVDVKKSDRADMSGATVAVVQVDDGAKVTIRSAPAGFQVDGEDAYWVTFEFSHDPANASTDAQLPDPDEGGKKMTVDVNAGADRVARAAARTGGWAYLFTGAGADNFRRRLDTVTNTKEDG